MDTLRILEDPTTLTWEYDREADVLYVAVGDPRPAVSVDLGEGVLARYDAERNEFVGLTVLGLRARLMRGLSLGEPA